jgi:probable HAF family extracellular repeat protein
MDRFNWWEIGGCITVAMAGVVGCGGAADAPDGSESSSTEQANLAFPDCEAFRYRVTDLGSLSTEEGDTYIAVGRLSRRSEIVGSSAFQAYLWQDGSMTGLGTLGGATSAALAINDSGLVVGLADTTDGMGSHAFSWRNGVMKDLGTLGGRYSQAVDVNVRGHIVGFSSIAGPDTLFHAFLYKSGVMHDLGTLGGEQSFAFAINRHSHVVGYSGAGAEFATYWHDGVVENFAGTEVISHAWDINDHGQIVGDIGGLPRAFLYSDGELIDLGAPGAVTHAFAINNRGAIVGITSHDEPQRPDLSGPEGFVTTGDGLELLRNVVDTCWNVIMPRDINDRGQIVAVAYACEGVLKRHALLLDPVRGCDEHTGARHEQ